MASKTGRVGVRMPLDDREVMRATIAEVLKKSESLCLDSDTDRAVLYGRLINALGVDE